MVVIDQGSMGERIVGVVEQAWIHLNSYRPGIITGPEVSVLMRYRRVEAVM